MSATGAIFGALWRIALVGVGVFALALVGDGARGTSARAIRSVRGARGHKPRPLPPLFRKASENGGVTPPNLEQKNIDKRQGEVV